MPPWRVSRVSAKDELVSRFSPPRPIERRPWSNSPPAGPAIPFIGSAAKPIPPPAGPPIPAARPTEPAAAPIGEPDLAPGEPAPGACMPVDDPSWLRKSSAISRSMPGCGCSCRPATWASTPTSRGAASRSSTCSTTCTAAVRPNRAIKTCGSGSLFLIVPVASALVMENRLGCVIAQVCMAEVNNLKPGNEGDEVAGPLKDSPSDTRRHPPLATGVSQVELGTSRGSIMAWSVLRGLQRRSLLDTYAHLAPTTAAPSLQPYRRTNSP